MTEPITANPAQRLPQGVFSPDDLHRALHNSRALPSPYAPPARLLCVEQTHNFGGGSIWPLPVLQATAGAAHAEGLAVHMDGARLMNAAIASGIDAAAYGAPMDSLWLDFTKGLGAPLGAVLAGSREFISRAARYKSALGGAMRQAGIAAAGCLHALDHHVARLADDHHQAARLATGLQTMPGVSLVYGAPATNIVFFEVSGTGLSGTEFASRCLARGVRIGPVQGRIRAVTHLDVSPAQVDQALAVMADVVAKAPGA